MKARVGIGPVALWCVFAVTPAAAQWVNHPTAGIPRSADGKPDLAAAAPRTPDGTPDLSGLWQIGGLGYATRITNVEMLPWAQAVYKERLETYGHDDPAVGCLPEGPRSGLAGLEPLRIIQTRNLMVILYETGAVRQIYLDGRPLPEDPTPSWMGYSVGRWDGETLVVDTIGYNDRTWLDFSGHPHSEALRVTERFRRTDFGHMQLAMTFDDPKTYVKPWTINVAVTFLPDTDLLETVCLENEKDRERLVGRASDERRSERKVAPAVLAGYTGAYEVGPLGTWQVSLDHDRLHVAMSDGGGPQPVVAQSDTVFTFPAIGGFLTFVPDSKGMATHFILTVVEGDFKAMRK
jgi:hypothetical protein